jgi:hypothetical protein
VRFEPFVEPFALARVVVVAIGVSSSAAARIALGRRGPL